MNTPKLCKRETPKEMLASPGVSHSVNTRTPSGNHHQGIRAKEQHLKEIFSCQPYEPAGPQGSFTITKNTWETLPKLEWFQLYNLKKTS